MSIYVWSNEISWLYYWKEVPLDFSYVFSGKTISELEQDWDISSTSSITISSSWVSGDGSDTMKYYIDMWWTSSSLTIKYDLAVGSHTESSVMVWWCGSTYNNYDLWFKTWAWQVTWYHQSMSWTIPVTLTYNFSTGVSTCTYWSYTWNETFTATDWLSLIQEETCITVTPWWSAIDNIDMYWS